LRRLADDLRLGDVVCFTGAVPHSRVHEHYATAHIFLNASRAEGFATTCLEAMACGLPIVSTPVGGFRDAIVNSVNGALVPQEDVEAFADRVLTLVADAPTRAAYSKRARETAEQSFDWETSIVPRYLDAYEEALKRRCGRAGGSTNQSNAPAADRGAAHREEPDSGS
jgi:glycosyltransferase involved in cell wall biosynthesis